MIKNYFLIFLRNFARNKTFSILNVGGFALGMAACILIVLFITHEQSFDTFHSKADRIFRLNETQSFEGMQEQQVALSMYPMGPALQREYPEIEEYVRIESRPQAIVRDKEKELSKHHLLFVDSTFFHLFDFPFLNGNRETALMSPKEIIITERLAKTLFNSVNAIGKTIEIKSGSEYPEYIVSAVLKDLPANSHLQFEFLLPMSALPKQPWMDTWDSNWLNTYLLLSDKSKADKLRAAFPAFEKKYLGEEDKFYQLLLQPFLSIHLQSENVTHDDMNHKKFSYAYIRTFFILAIAVLLIAIFNFINLSTALATSRAKEAGVRKTIGAGNWQLMRQFTGEAIMFSFIAFGIALVLTLIALPIINKVFDREIELNFILYAKRWLWMMGAVLTVGIISGLYPAYFISRFRPITMIKGMKIHSSPNRISLRPVLVVVQFTIAVWLIISTIIITQQLEFARKKDVGFDKEQVVLVNMNQTANRKYESLKNTLLAKSTITDITAYNERLGKNINQWGADYVNEKGETKHISVSHLYVDYNFIPFFKIPIKEGRNFSPALADTGRSYLINESLAKELETSKPIGTMYKGSFRPELGSIVGVVKDFNFNSIHHKIAPLYISIQNWDFNEMAIRLKAGDPREALAHIENVWKKEVPDMPFSYSFLDEHLASLYVADQQAAKVINIAMALSIIIACLGLFGMALYSINNRTKEIGIRKVLGASVNNIAVKLSGQFIKLVLIASLLSFPLAWMGMQKWLEDFAFRIDINWWVFVISGVVAVIIALATVSFQAIKAAIANPVKSLRTE